MKENIDEQVIDKNEIADEVARNDAVAAMAKSLGMEGDFNPEGEGIKDDEPQSQDEQLIALMADSDGAMFAASQAINTFESLMQQFGHNKFTIEETQKEQTAKAVSPVVQKYGGSMVGVFGNYKDEALAALAVGSLAFASIKQIKELKAIDAAKEVKPAANSEKTEEQEEKVA